MIIINQTQKKARSKQSTGNKQHNRLRESQSITTCLLDNPVEIAAGAAE